jgi:hypothetical protein
MKHPYPVAVASAIALVVTLLVTQVGVPFALIVGGSAIIAFVVWLLTTYRHPVDGRRILPLYVLAVGMQYVHMTEEFLTGFAVHFSALTGADLTPDKFVVVALLGGGMAYAFSGFGLVRQNPLANYVLWFFLIGPAGLVNSIAHVSFPFLAGTTYFPGLITVVLPTVFGTALAVRILADVRRESQATSARSSVPSSAPSTAVGI